MVAKKLSARAVETNKVPGKLGDGDGLWLVTSKAGSKRWAYIFRWDGRLKEMGLGSFPTVSLEDARDKAAAARKLLKAGTNPIEQSRADKEARRIEVERAKSFGEYAKEAILTLTAELRSAKHRAQWTSTLETYAAPIWDKPIASLKPADIAACLQPIWTAKPETARRVRQRIEAVFSYAIAAEVYTGLNPARLADNLKNLLPRKNKARRVKHHKAMPYEEIAALIERLDGRDGVGTYALELLILTGCRSGEIRLLTWGEVDFNAKLLRLPGERTKSGNPFVVPLSDAAIEVLEAVRGLSGNMSPDSYVFPGRKPGMPLSNMVYAMALRKLKIDATAHGFRSSFRDWAHDLTRFKREFIEQCLGHSIGDQTERAYLRSDALVERRKIMAAWGNYIAPRTGNVIALPTKKTRA